MDITAFQHLTCPLDGLPLSLEGSSWRCPDGHNFDRARQGHTHLLPVQNKRSRDPGDSKDMVAARQRFLNAGHYQAVAQAINQAVLSHLPSADVVQCLDAGSGEGYYLRQLALAAEAHREPVPHTMQLLGLDISKWAVLAAARQDKRPNWVVGSNARLPVADSSLDTVLCVFGFPVYPEFRRVLKPGGILLQVDPGPDHLRELRAIIYPSLKANTARNDHTAALGFSPGVRDTLTFSVHLTSSEAIADLLAMTPHLYRASSEGKARALALEELTVTIDVGVLPLVRQPDSSLT